ncbi:phosphoribosylformylglycinamidine cyclo-ligase [Jatrophihabitans endophyticus]|uniref:Phosphoribosylformylglycinamidine cyclo-ligase n=1 Tax=Jatrophihabitans endophyticus TaxID=1206085 RepID=A0A1M5HGF1_9ACTN|nr:phosphoribosylformylglycinamidine cyclo-ligase [Jatrophihabitans endophyticus]SHG14968.1 phosphoribosylformylglycinamidine cyclo-ligase [Jatrophihabitans endophyticus]
MSNAYAGAGVDVEAGERAVELMKASVARTDRPETRGGLGGFAGLFALDLTRHPKPVLASSTDGVGTKLVIAQAMDRHDTIGIDLVAMVVDDLVVVGAEPLLLTDYIATGKVVPEKIAAIVSGIAEGCVQAGCALVGGETAEHPGVMGADEYDISGTGVGVVDADAVLGSERVRPGDVLVAMGSSGVHSNGYSLVRHVLLDQGGLDLTATPDVLGGRTLGEELLTPTRIYALDCLALAAGGGAHAFAHITGGGLAGNLARVLPPGTAATVDRATWAPQPVFDLVRTTGDVSRADLELAFNLGVGMVAVVPAARVQDAVGLLTDRGVPAWPIGDVREAASTQPGEVTLVANYAGPASDWV